MWTAPQVGARVDTELVGEIPAQPVVGGQRIGGAAVGGQGAHQLTGQPLPQRMSGNQFRQLGDHVAALAEPEIRLDPVRPRFQPLLLQARCPGDRVRRIPASASGSPRHSDSALTRVSRRPERPRRSTADDRW